jgi:hypothetical protein
MPVFNAPIEQPTVWSEKEGWLYTKPDGEADSNHTFYTGDIVSDDRVSSHAFSPLNTWNEEAGRWENTDTIEPDQAQNGGFQ